MQERNPQNKKIRSINHFYATARGCKETASWDKNSKSSFQNAQCYHFSGNSKSPNFAHSDISWKKSWFIFNIRSFKNCLAFFIYYSTFLSNIIPLWAIQKLTGRNSWPSISRSSKSEKSGFWWSTIDSPLMSVPCSR